MSEWYDCWELLAWDSPSQRRLEVVNQVLAELATATAKALSADMVSDRPRLLPSVGPELPRPRNPLRRSDLLINARHEPVLHEQLAAELASADQIDLLCAFIKWQGLRLLVDALATRLRAARPMRGFADGRAGPIRGRLSPFSCGVDDLAQLGIHIEAVCFEPATGLGPLGCAEDRVVLRE